MNIIRQNTRQHKSIVYRYYLSYSTQTQTQTKSDIFRRLLGSGDPRTCLKTILNEWVEKGNQVQKSDLQALIKRLRNLRRYTHALQISEWMTHQQNNALTATDHAIRLDLISKDRGFTEAEEYFLRIPEDIKDYQIHTALLSCYAHYKNLEKAEALFGRMTELGFAKSPFLYNVMLGLYSKTGQYEKLDGLMRNMEENGVECNLCSFNIRLCAYVGDCDLDGMEMFLAKMEGNPFVHLSWSEYAVVATGYQKAGMIDKADVMLKKSEQLVTDQTRKMAWEVIMSLYASLGKRDEVFRIWNLYKRCNMLCNSAYLVMMSSLLKLDDIGGAEELFNNWEANHLTFDFRIPNLLLSKYCHKGLMEKAEGLVKRLGDSGREPKASTWERLAAGYRKHGQLAKAVEAMEKAALSDSLSRVNLNPSTLAAGLECLNHKGDLGVAGNILNSVKEQCHFSMRKIRELCKSALGSDKTHER